MFFLGSDAIKRKRFREEKCEHGYWGGKNAGRCPICESAKQRQEEQSRRRRRVDHELAQIRGVNSTRLKELEIELIKYYKSQLDYYRSIRPYDFEKKVADLYRAQGFTAEVTSQAGDEGKDIILFKGGVRYYVECKRYSKSTKVSRPDAQKLAGAMIGDGVTNGIIVTTSGFTDECLEWVRNAQIHIELVGADDFMLMVERHVPSTRYPSSFVQVCTEVISNNVVNESGSMLKEAASPCGCEIEIALPSKRYVTCRQGHQVVSEAFELEQRMKPSVGGRKMSHLAKLCPKCGAKMVLRKKKRSRKKFWGCPNWPTCNGYRSL